jgi:hypothetical protein
MTSTVVPKSRDPITSLLGRRYPHVQGQAPWPVVEEKTHQRWWWWSSQRANELRVSRNSKRSSYLSLQQQRWSHEAGKLPWRSRRRSPPQNSPNCKTFTQLFLQIIETFPIKSSRSQKQVVVVVANCGYLLPYLLLLDFYFILFYFFIFFWGWFVGRV